MNQLIAGVLSLSLVGCSFVFVHGPDNKKPANSEPDCTSGKTWPIIDTVVAAVAAAVAISAIQGEDDPMTAPGIDVDNEKLPRAVAGVGGIGVAALAGVGAFIGFRRVSACRATREQYRLAHAPVAPPVNPGYYAPPQGDPQQGYPQQGAAPPQPNGPPQQGYPPPQPQGYARPQPTGAPRPLPPGWVPTPMPSGYEGGACLANNACAQGLVCASSLCVRPPPAATP